MDLNELANFKKYSSKEINECSELIKAIKSDKNLNNEDILNALEFLKLYKQKYMCVGGAIVASFFTLVFFIVILIIICSQ